MLALVEESDPDSYRRIPMFDATLWKNMQAAGAFSNFARVLPAEITAPHDARMRIEAVWRDLILITWWATAMSTAANRLVEVQKAVRKLPVGTPLENDQTFMDARKKLAADATANNKSNFDEPWGIVAQFYASQRSGIASAALISSRLALALPYSG